MRSNRGRYTCSEYKRVYVDRDSAYGANFNRYEVGTKWEMIQRGYNVTAKPFSPSDSIGNSLVATWKINGENIFKDPEVVWNFSKFELKKKLEESFYEWGKKARVIVRVSWIDGGTHGFTARFSNGKIIYEDPQAAVELDIDEVIKKCTLVKGKNWFMRVDNRAFTEAIKDAVENVE